jgi:glycosyltransferase involved in cell wall biosynthesis
MGWLRHRVVVGLLHNSTAASMRILMLAQNYPPTIGGEEQHVRNLSMGLAARGHDVAVATLWEEGQPTFEEIGGIQINRLHGITHRASMLYSTGRRFAPPLPDPEITWNLRRIVRAFRPEIVHAHNWLVHSFVPLKERSDAHLVLTLHDYSLVCAKKRLMYHDVTCTGPGIRKCLECAADYYGVARGIPTTVANWVMGSFERAAVDMFIPVSSAVAVGNNLAAARLPYQVIPNFVPDDVATPRAGMEPFLAQLPGGEFILFVGDLSPDKGFGVLLRAYAGLVDAPPLVTIGRPSVDTPKEFPPNVVLLTNWPHDAVMEAWRRSIFGLVPSVWPDPCPTVAMEAMATGRPVIAARMGGLPDIVDDGETGFLVAPGDEGALRQRMKQLLSDSGLRSRMGTAARKKVVEFQACTVIPRIEHVYESLTSNGH